jgi:hypothetical protein
MDPSVSFDGRRVIFSVLYASFRPVTHHIQTYSADGAALTREAQDPIGAQLFEADLTTFAIRALDYRALGDFDTAPVYIPWDESRSGDSDRIMFTSNRARELPSSLITEAPARAFNKYLLQLYIADSNATNARRVGVHDRDGILHPFVLSDGRVIFTTWSNSHMGAFRSNNSTPRRHSSLQNKAWLASVNSKGGFFVADYGRHGKSRKFRGGTSEISSTGLHFITETSDKKWVCVSDYYRTNNKGGGLTTCYQREAVGVEGAYPPTTDPGSAFMPRFFVRPFTFGNVSDNVSEHGATRDPMGLPGNQLMVTYLRGNACQRPDLAIRDFPNNSCDAGIFRTVNIPTDASGLQVVVDNPNYHEFMARVAEPYNFIYGMEKPRFAGHQGTSTNGRCYIGNSTMESETQPLRPYSFNSSERSAQDCASQGCKAREISETQVRAIRFWEVLHHDSSFLHRSRNYENSGQPNYLKTLASHRLKLLGDAPIESDGSFAAEIPCETTYVMAGVSADGEVIMRDQVPQSLRRGEVRTCTGCHVHSGRTTRAFTDSIAGRNLTSFFSNPTSTPITSIGAAGGYREMWRGALTPQVTVNAAGAVSTVTEGQIYEYQRHIVPVLNASCVRCHNGASAPLDLRETNVISNFFGSVASGHEQTSFYPTELWNTITNKKPVEIPGDWEIPRLSKYVHMGFAIESLFYWKTVGRRTDGRTDATMTNDLDYGTPVGPDPHANVNPGHIRIIKNWLDSGAYLHQGLLPVDYRPPNQ